jgi:DNA mismatch repair protein MutS
VKAKTLFSTHYHELTVLEESLPQLKNVHVGAVEQNGEVVFLHKLMDGPADKSYGIHVAKIAGMPTELLSRAATILSALEADAPIQKQPEVIEENEQLSLFNEVSTAELGVVDSLKKANLLEMNPMEALNFLYELQKRI